MRIQFIFGMMAIVILAFFAGMFLKGDLTGKAIAVTKEDSQQIMDARPDVVNLNEGTIVAWSSDDLTTKSEGLVEFWSSRKIKGLFIRYNIQEKKVMAGLPVMKSEKELVFDGKKHVIAYTYKKDGNQMIFWDGEPVAQGAYSGIAEPAVGMVVGYPPQQIGADIQSFPSNLDEQAIKELE